MSDAIRHPLTGELLRQVAALNRAIAEHAGEECDLVLSWTTGGRLRAPRLLLRTPCRPDADVGLSESEQTG